METWRFLMLCFYGTAISWANAQNDMNQSQPTMSNMEMPSSTEGVSIAMMNGSSSSNDTMPMVFDGGMTMTTTVNDHAVLIGNSSLQPMLHVESSTPDSSTQTNQTEPSTSATTEAMTESSSTDSKTLKWSTVMNTSPWVPGKFPPPSLVSEKEGNKNTGSGSLETGSTTTTIWHVDGNDNPTKDKYDMYMAHEPVKAEESSTANGMETTISWLLESGATQANTKFTQSDLVTSLTDYLPRGTGVGSSKEIDMDKTAKSSMQKPNGNGVEMARVSSPLVAVLSTVVFLFCRF